MGSNDMPSLGTDEQQDRPRRLDRPGQLDRPEQHGLESPTPGCATPGRPGRGRGRRVLGGAAARLRNVRGAAGDRGMATAEYAIATIAAVGFAGLLVVVLRSGEVQALLQGLIRGALST